MPDPGVQGLRGKGEGRTVKAVTVAQLQDFFRAAAVEFDVRVPIALEDGTRALGRPAEGPLALSGGALPGKPLSVFFPQFETELTYRDHSVEAQEARGKPLLVVGLTAQDADCLEFIDRFFAERFRDDVYFSKRAGAVVAVVSGRCGRDGEFLKIAGGKCDFELACGGARFLVVPYSEAGRRLCEAIPGDGEASPRELEELRRQSDALDASFADAVRRASQLIRDEKVPEAFWQDIADRCIGCTACNLACPTCTCFDVYDWKCARCVERQRIWDSCQLAGFMREASGHNPLGTQAARVRRRIHHKLAADLQRWGSITCFLCGRCDRVCPTGIGMEAVSREIVRRFG
jgi:sulfhydrogenase subunit beta (sulfur reductase)